MTFQDTVYFLSGSTLSSTTSVLATVPLDGTGHAAFSTSGLSATNHFITAAYSGDGNFVPGSMSMVEKIHTFGSATSLNSTPNPSTTGQSVTFTATVSPLPPGSATPTGMVTFQEGSAVLAQVSLNGSGTASFSTTSLSAGSHSVTAAYASDSIYASSSGSRSQSVQSGATTTTVSSSPNPSVYGQAVTVTAQVTTGGAVPTGTVTFQEGAAVLASNVAVDATGKASFVTSTLVPGSHTVTANFTGTNGWSNSTGSNSASPQVVNKSATTTQLSSSGTTSVFSQSVTFTATVTATSPGSGLPTSSVTFKDGGTTLATVSLDGTGRAIFTTSTLAIGSHSITAAYVGDAHFNASTSAALNQTVNQDGTTTTLTATPNPASVGQAITLQTSVTVNPPGTGTPSGTVTFLDKGKALASATLDAAGHAAFTTSSLGQGNHQFTVSYAGNATYAGSTSAAIVENIKK